MFKDDRTQGALSPIPPIADARKIMRGGTHNARDAGGYPTHSGKWIVKGRIYRSDSLDEMTSKDISEFEDRGIAAVIDLRETIERESAPSIEVPDVENIHLPLFRETLFARPVDGFPTLNDQYRLIIDKHGDQLANIISTIADRSAKPFLVHCTAGKDRTGLIIAIIQSLLGVDIEYIISDHQASQEILTGQFESKVKKLYARAELSQEILGDKPTHVPEHSLSQIFQQVSTEHGSLEKYLMHHGLSQSTLSALKEHLLVSAEEL